MARNLGTLDPAGMDGHLRGLPGQLRSMDQVSIELPDFGEVRSLVFLGMGGSAIAGGLTTALVGNAAPYPVFAVRGYEVPRWLGPRALGVAVSHSGNTEETLAASRQLRDQGGTVIGITSGRILADACLRAGEVIVDIPTGMPPRAAFGYLAGATFRVAQGLALMEDPNLSARADGLDQYMAGLLPAPGEAAVGELAHLADALSNALPVFLAPDGFLATIAYRWCCQFNENAKRPARCAILPECNHNEVVAWGGENLGPVIVFEDPTVPARVQRRLDVSCDILLDAGATMRRVRGSGDDLLDRVFSLGLLGDALSLELAYRAGIDPTPIPQIDRLKDALSNGPDGS